MELFYEEIALLSHWYTLTQIRRVTNTNIFFWVSLQIPFTKCSIVALAAKAKPLFFYYLDGDLLAIKSKWLGPFSQEDIENCSKTCVRWNEIIALVFKDQGNLNLSDLFWLTNVALEVVCVSHQEK